MSNTATNRGPFTVQQLYDLLAVMIQIGNAQLPVHIVDNDQNEIREIEAIKTDFDTRIVTIE